MPPFATGSKFIQRMILRDAERIFYSTPAGKASGVFNDITSCKRFQRKLLLFIIGIPAVVVGLILFLLLTDTEVAGYEPVLITAYSKTITKDEIYTEIEAERAIQKEARTSVANWDGTYPDISLEVFNNWPYTSGHKDEHIKVVLPLVMAIHKESMQRYQAEGKDYVLYPSYLLTLYAGEAGWGFFGAYGWNMFGMKVAGGPKLYNGTLASQGRWKAGNPTVKNEATGVWVPYSGDPDINAERERFVLVGEVNGVTGGANYAGWVAHYWCSTVEEGVERFFESYYDDVAHRTAHGYDKILEAQNPIDQMSAHGSSGWGTDYSSMNNIFASNDFAKYDPEGEKYLEALNYKIGDPLP